MDRFEQIKEQYRRWPGDTEYNGSWGNDVAWLIDEVERLRELTDGQENALSIAKKQIHTAGKAMDAQELLIRSLQAEIGILRVAYVMKCTWKEGEGEAAARAEDAASGLGNDCIDAFSYGLREMEREAEGRMEEALGEAVGAVALTLKSAVERMKRLAGSWPEALSKQELLCAEKLRQLRLIQKKGHRAGEWELQCKAQWCSDALSLWVKVEKGKREQIQLGEIKYNEWLINVEIRKEVVRNMRNTHIYGNAGSWQYKAMEWVADALERDDFEGWLKGE